MTKIKICGLFRPDDIEAANELLPDYIGFVFWPRSKRYVTPETAARLKGLLRPEIKAVGVFVDEDIQNVSAQLHGGVIDIAQLHGGEDADYIARLRALSGRPVIKAFRVKSAADLSAAERCPADHILLDSGAGTGSVFDWSLLSGMNRPFFLAGGLDPDNVGQAVSALRPFAVDVSSGVETGGIKDKTKMAAFVSAVRKEEKA